MTRKRKARITKRSVDALPPGQSLTDTEMRGFVVRRLKSGLTVYGKRYTDPITGRERWDTLGHHGAITPDQARKLAQRLAGKVAAGNSPAEERRTGRVRAAAAVDTMLDAFLEQHARSRKLKTAGRIERLFAAHVRPMLGRRSIYDLRKSDTADLSAHVATHHGLATAHMVEGYWNQALAWRSARDDDFNPPIVRGLSSYRPGEHARSRVLDDPELCDLKTALAELGDSVPAGYPPLVWALLLSAQRRQNVASMHWAAIVGTAWVIAADSYKTGVEMTVPLSGALLELLGNRKEGFVFGRNGARPFSDFGRCKLILDRKLTEIRARDGREPMTAWVIHDLRRTARSLMSRAGVPTDHAERVLGHAIPGVRAVYDRHDFYAEKANALEALARLVNRIVDPTAGEVFSFGQPRQVRA